MCYNAVNNLLEKYDIYLYFGAITSTGHELLTTTIEQSINELKKEAYLIPVTTGGDPDAGFRIARAMGHYYPQKVKCFIPDICKSAGTLITIGSSELVISNKGELGPLDIQLQNKEELLETSSGLDIMQALRLLQETAKFSFTEYLIDLRKNGLGTKIAAQIASKMVSNIVSPIISQIDPIRLGEHQRALSIATAYGLRLNSKFNNTTPENIEKLITAYPTHSFVIDRKEASKLFKNVSAPSPDENSLELFIRNSFSRDLKELARNKDPIVIDLRKSLTSESISRDSEVGNDQKKMKKPVADMTVDQ
jgi:hypothetical protein